MLIDNMLPEEIKNEILELQNLYPFKRSALIPSLHLAQKTLGYLPLEVQKEVAELFNLDLNEVTSVVTFYDMFYEAPQGKHHVHVCKNISCMLRGGDEVLQALSNKLGINVGETTEDGEFTLIASECLAACDRAPVILTEKIKGPIKIEEIDEVIESIRGEHSHG